MLSSSPSCFVILYKIDDMVILRKSHITGCVLSISEHVIYKRAINIRLPWQTSRGNAILEARRKLKTKVKCC